MESSFARRSGDFDLRAERHQRRRGIRRMDDVARPAAEDRVKTAIAGHRVANLPAFAQAGEVRRAKIPAERPLANIAGDRAGIANLRRRRFAGGIGKNQQFFPDRRVFFDVRELGQRADAKPAALFFDIVQTGDSFQINRDNRARRHDPSSAANIRCRRRPPPRFFSADEIFAADRPLP